MAVTVCYLVYCRYKSSQRDLTRMSKDMEALMKAEETLRDLQVGFEFNKNRLRPWKISGGLRYSW